MDISQYLVILTDIAIEDMGAIYKYISENLLEEIIANELVDKIERSILILKSNPYLGMEVHIKQYNEVYRRLVINNYIVLYEVDEEFKQVIVYRVLYSRMNYLK